MEEKMKFEEILEKLYRLESSLISTNSKLREYEVFNEQLAKHQIEVMSVVSEMMNVLQKLKMSQNMLSIRTKSFYDSQK